MLFKKIHLFKSTWSREKIVGRFHTYMTVGLALSFLTGFGFGVFLAN